MNKALYAIMVGWLFLTLVNYYYVPYFLTPLLWLAMAITLLITSIKQVAKLIRQRHSLTYHRQEKAVVFSMLFLLTFFRSFTGGIIEKTDWILLESKREAIVHSVLNRELNPNVSKNRYSRICQLPYKFPVVSNGGNEIGILRNEVNRSTTVVFWVFRNFFDSPSTHFIYTNDSERITKLEIKIADSPNTHWKLKENWYRTYGSW